jgi:hypothetical protein
MVRVASKNTSLRAGVLWPPDVFGIRADQMDQPDWRLCEIRDVIAGESLARARKSSPEARNSGAQRGQRYTENPQVSGPAMPGRDEPALL